MSADLGRKARNAAQRLSISRRGVAVRVALLLAMAGCKSESTAGDEPGDADAPAPPAWTPRCTRDAECGQGSCLCGWCSDACRAARCAGEQAPTCVDDGSGASAAPEPNVLWTARDEDASLNQIIASGGGRLYVAGGWGQTISDLAYTYPGFLLEAVGPDGAVVWARKLPAVPAESNALSVAETLDGSLVAVAERYVDGPRTVARRFSAAGDPQEEWIVTPSFQRLARAADGSILGAGWELLEMRGGRAFTRALVGALLPNEEPSILFTRVGSDGSVSGALDLSVAEIGDFAVAGSVGTAPDSNAALPWVAMATGGGRLLWEDTTTEDQAACSTRSVSVDPEHVTLSAGTCQETRVRAHAQTGELLWERSLPHPPVAVLALDDGYAIGLREEVPGEWRPQETAILMRFDRQHHLVWQTEAAGCSGFRQLVRVPGGIVAGADCDYGMLVVNYVDTP